MTTPNTPQEHPTDRSPRARFDRYRGKLEKAFTGGDLWLVTAGTVTHFVEAANKEDAERFVAQRLRMGRHTYRDGFVWARNIPLRERPRAREASALDVSRACEIEAARLGLPYPLPDDPVDEEQGALFD